MRRPNHKSRRGSDSVIPITDWRDDFRYTKEHVNLIYGSIPKTATGALASRSMAIAFCIHQIELAASLYLGCLEESAKLPSRNISRKARETILADLDRVRALIPRDEFIVSFIESHRQEIYEGGSSPTRVLCEMFLIGKIGQFDLENELGASVLNRLIRSHQAPSYGESMKDGKPHIHRNDFIEKAVREWAWLNQVPVRDCEISAAETSPMLMFLHAVLDPVFEIAPAGQAIDSDMIKKVVERIRSESSITTDAE